MSGNNRYLKGDINSIKLPVHGATVVEPGDLLILGATTETQQHRKAEGVADYYAYPFSGVTRETGEGVIRLCKNWFIGVAMSGSASGTTNEVTVATSGMFRYPLRNITAKEGALTCGTTVGYIVSAATPTASTTSGCSAQAVMIQGHGGASAAVDGGSTAFLGYCVITKPAGTKTGGASYVDFTIRTKYGPGGLVT